MVFAEDEEGVELEKPLEIHVQVDDVNDNPPVCNEAVFEVQENEPIGNNVRPFINTHTHIWVFFFLGTLHRQNYFYTV